MTLSPALARLANAGAPFEGRDGMRINNHTMVSAVAIRHVWAANLRIAWDYRRSARAVDAGSVRLIYRKIYHQRRLVARALRRLLREAKPAREEAAQ